MPYVTHCFEYIKIEKLYNCEIEGSLEDGRGEKSLF